MCPLQDAAALGVPGPLPAPHQLGPAQREVKGDACKGDACEDGARTPVVSVAASPRLDSPLSCIKVDVADWGLEVSAAAPAAPTPF